MRRLLIVSLTCCSVLAVAGGVSALKVADPTPQQSFSDTSEGWDGPDPNQGYLEVGAEDGAVLRACNENGDTPGGDDTTGYIWVNPDGESTTPTYGNSTIGAGDADGEDGAAPSDVDGDTDDDCAGNNNDPAPPPAP